MFENEVGGECDEERDEEPPELLVLGSAGAAAVAGTPDDKNSRLRMSSRLVANGADDVGALSVSMVIARI